MLLISSSKRQIWFGRSRSKQNNQPFNTSSYADGLEQQQVLLRLLMKSYLCPLCLLSPWSCVPVRNTETNDYFCRGLICWMFFNLWATNQTNVISIGATWVSETTLALFSALGCVAVISFGAKSCRRPALSWFKSCPDRRWKKDYSIPVTFLDDNQERRLKISFWLLSTVPSYQNVSMKRK